LNRDVTFAPTPTPSAFRETALTPAEIANHLRDELKRLRRRRQLVGEEMPSQQRHSPSPPMSPSSSSTAEFMMDSSETAHRKPATEKPVFTLKQMTMICERMCKERTDKVREEYDRILQQKLSEQYDAFVKFIDHQIEQRFNQSQLPSYLS